MAIEDEDELEIEEHYRGPRGDASSTGSDDDGGDGGWVLAAYAVHYQRLCRQFRALGWDGGQAARRARTLCDEIAEGGSWCRGADAASPAGAAAEGS